MTIATITTNSSNTKPRRSVTFANRVRFRCTIHINDYTDDEVYATWYSLEEYDTIRQDAAHLVHQFEEDYPQSAIPTEHEDETVIDYCYRGLEGHMKWGNQYRTEQYYAVVDAVLQEQDYQRQMNDGFVFDSFYLADVARKETVYAQLEAYQRARSDAGTTQGMMHINQSYSTTTTMDRSNEASTTTTTTQKGHRKKESSSNATPSLYAIGLGLSPNRPVVPKVA